MSTTHSIEQAGEWNRNAESTKKTAIQIQNSQGQSGQHEQDLNLMELKALLSICGLLTL